MSPSELVYTLGFWFWLILTIGSVAWAIVTDQRR